MTSLFEIYDGKISAGTLRDDDAQRLALEELERVRIGILAAKPGGFFRKATPSPKGLYLWGGVGRGKSMVMDLFVDALEVPNRRVHFHAFMQEVQSKLHEVRKRGVEDALTLVAKDIIGDLKCLALDEMQISDITDAMLVGRLFEQLMEAGVVVVTTSNRVPDDLYKDGLNRALFLPFIDLLKREMIVHEMTSPTDYRQDRLAGNEVYFAPINADARAATAKLFKELAGNDPKPMVLKVKGREVVLPAVGNGVARAGFYDLCGIPLGPADYLAIAEAVRVLVLEEVPQLSSANFNEAKRFVTLIDTLYEARVQLIASAAAKPEMLYTEGAGSFEFERTASRLREMQSADWITA